MLRLSVSKNGYHTVTLSKYGRRQTLLVGRAVLETFQGAPPAGCRAIRGLGGKLDDRLVNLSWGTTAHPVPAASDVRY